LTAKLLSNDFRMTFLNDICIRTVHWPLLSLSLSLNHFPLLIGSNSLQSHALPSSPASLPLFFTCQSISASIPLSSSSSSSSPSSSSQVVLLLPNLLSNYLLPFSSVSQHPQHCFDVVTFAVGLRLTTSAQTSLIKRPNRIVCL
jgi:hypothetical protein